MIWGIHLVAGLGSQFGVFRGENLCVFAPLRETLTIPLI
jgi:hypothetical protein